MVSGAGAATETVTRTSDGDWNGQLYSLAAGLSYEIDLGRFSLRPGAALASRCR